MAANPTSANAIEVEMLAGSDVEFRAETIYFLVLDRFSVGNAEKFREQDEMFDGAHSEWYKYWAGTSRAS